MYYAVMCCDLRRRVDVMVDRRSWRSSAARIAREQNALALVESAGQTTGPDGIPVRLYYIVRGTCLTRKEAKGKGGSHAA